MLKPFLFISLLSILIVPDLKSQLFNCSDRNHATTYDWTFKNRVQILDRSHSYGGKNYDKGFGVVFSPNTTREYDLDTHTYDYKTTDSYNWYKCGQGSRIVFGSYTKSKLLNFNHVKHDIDLKGNSQVKINAILQQDARADRAFFEITYQKEFSQNSSFYITHSLTDEKQDLDLTAGYILSTANYGKLEVAITAQDYINNLVNDVGNKPTKRVRNFSQIEYETTPLFIYSRYTSDPEQFWYFDISSGYQPTSKFSEFSTEVLNYEVRKREYLYFFNSSLSINISDFTFGGFYYLDKSSLNNRSFGTPYDGYYSTRQELSKFGFFSYYFSKRFDPHVILSIEDYADRQFGSDFSSSTVLRAFDYTEHRFLLDVGTAIKFNDSKFKILTRYLRFDRDENNAGQSYLLTESLGTEVYIYDVQHRASLSFQVTPSPNLFFELGFSLDLDLDRNANPDYKEKKSDPRLFDKGFGKLLFRF